MSAIFIPTGNAGKLREFTHAFALQNKDCIGLKKAEELLGREFAWQPAVEDRETFVGNGYQKLAASLPLLKKLTAHHINMVLIDDSGLCVPRLNFKPGVHSAVLAGEPRDDARNRKFLIDLLRNKLGLSDHDREPAFFVCSLLLATRLTTEHDSVRSHAENFVDVQPQLEELEPKIFEMVAQKLQVNSSAAYGYRNYFMSEDEVFQLDMITGFCTGSVATLEQELLVGEGHGYDSLFFPRRQPELSFASIPLSAKNQMSHRSEALRGLSEWEKSRIVRGEIQALF